MKYTHINLILLVIICHSALCHKNKYSKEANIKEKEENVSVRDLKMPFRMHKMNLLWEKAKNRLTESKLKSLYGELKLHDKEEALLKRQKAEGLDKEGIKEGQLRRKLLDIMSMYGMLEHFENTQEPFKPPKQFNEASEEHINKSLFKDKKLNKLWTKAEQAGFSTVELQALREEFEHHQDKIDQYYSLLGDAKLGPNDDEHHENSIDDGLDKFNSLDGGVEEKSKMDYLSKVNTIRDKHQDIKDGFDRLHHLAARGPNSKEFVEPKVQGLWKVALESNFKQDELESLRIELRHYEDRLLKLRHLQVEHAMAKLKEEKDLKASGAKSSNIEIMEDHIKKQARKVDKLHLDLESRIMQNHIEL